MQDNKYPIIVIKPILPEVNLSDLFFDDKGFVRLDWYHE